MTKEFSPPFNKNNQYQFWGVDCQSYCLLKFGFKPVIRFQINQSVLKDFQKAWCHSGFYILIKKFTSSFYGTSIKEPIFLAYISLKPRLSQKAFEADKKGDRMALGELLGYPLCCVKNFKENLSQKDYDLTIRTLFQTKNSPLFYCHSIFNFESKLSSKEVNILRRHGQVFQNSRYLFLIKYIPCSFDCGESVKIGKRTLEILKKEFSELAQEIEFVLKKPMLYFNYFNWLIFDGEVKKNQLFYRQILPYKSLFPEKNLEIIKKGNHLIVSDKEILIFDDKKLVKNSSRSCLSKERKIKSFQKENQYKGVLINFR